MGSDISVIVPAYNAGRYISETLHSIYAQGLLPDEVIVVDDGSTDHTIEQLQKFSGLTVIRSTRKGSAEARNQGVRVSSKRFLTFLDADDLWLPEKLKLQREFMEASPDTELIFGMVENFISPELSVQEQEQIACPSGIMRGIHAGTMMIRRDAFLKYGFFQADLLVSQFVEWWSRAELAGARAIVMPETVMRRRLHLSNTTRLHSTELQSLYLRHLHKRLYPDRQGPG